MYLNISSQLLVGTHLCSALNFIKKEKKICDVAV